MDEVIAECGRREQRSRFPHLVPARAHTPRAHPRPVPASHLGGRAVLLQTR
ncbi:hypothetical protein ACH4U6_35280 [Streptomyces netropsis]|uniref:hypothetical protein n=1 Tax=Streptomyces netropsis TaxID=55404 RepID=UPI0037AD8DF7